jgi:hypothetical protein
MIPVKLKPKFRCAFCPLVRIQHVMVRHEKTCYYNPNRVCYKCNNTGKYTEKYDYYDYGGSETTEIVDCPHCITHKEILAETFVAIKQSIFV